MVCRAAGAFKERREEIPVSQLEAFLIEPEVTPRVPWDSFLVLVWRDGPDRKHKKAPVFKDDPAVLALLAELERLRPDANLLALPPREAMKKLGIRTARAFQLWVVLGCLVFFAAVFPIVYVAQKKKEPRGDHCGSLPVSCLRTVDLYLSDPQMAPVAARELESACAGDDLGACATLAPFLVDGAGVPRNPKRAVEAAERACSGQVASGCCNLGVMYASGHGVERDDARAAGLYRRACDLGDVQRGCYNYGMALSNGLGVAEDSAAAVDFLRRACEAGEPNGCLSLGTLYWRGQGVQKDPERARALWERACKAGHQDACTNLQLK